MATRRKKAESTDSALPKGFHSLLPKRVEGYVRAKEGGMVQGTLLGRFDKKGRYSGAYYQIRLTVPCLCAQVYNADSDSYVDAEMQTGQIVSVDERSALESLKDKKGWEVCIVFIGKEELPDGGTYWRMEVGGRPGAPGAADDLPF